MPQEGRSIEVTPIPAVERTSSGRLRLPRAAAHVERPLSLSFRSNVTICILCGSRVPFGRMLSHKNLVHGESFPPGKRVRNVKPNAVLAAKHPTRKKRKRKARAVVYSGGLPSLGKRR